MSQKQVVLNYEQRIKLLTDERHIVVFWKNHELPPGTAEQIKSNVGALQKTFPW